MNKNRVLGIVLFIIVIVLAGLGYYYLTISKPQTEAVPSPSPQAAQEEAAPSPTPKLVEVPFDYQVTSVTETQVVMTGDKGEISLPNDERVRVYRGAPPNEVEASFSDLEVDQKIKLNMVPGKAAWVYILE